MHGPNHLSSEGFTRIHYIVSCKPQNVVCIQRFKPQTSGVTILDKATNDSVILSIVRTLHGLAKGMSSL